MPRGFQFRSLEKRSSLLRSIPRSSVFPIRLLFNFFFVVHSSAGEEPTSFNKGCWLSFRNQQFYRKAWIKYRNMWRVEKRLNVQRLVLLLFLTSKREEAKGSRERTTGEKRETQIYISFYCINSFFAAAVS